MCSKSDRTFRVVSGVAFRTSVGVWCFVRSLQNRIVPEGPTGVEQCSWCRTVTGSAQELRGARSVFALLAPENAAQPLSLC